MKKKSKTTKRRPARATRPAPKAAPQASRSPSRSEAQAVSNASKRFRLFFRDGIAPRDVTALTKTDADEQGRRLSASFTFAQEIPG